MSRETMNPPFFHDDNINAMLGTANESAPSRTSGHEKRQKIRRRNARVALAALCISAASFVGVKVAEKVNEPAKIEPAACTVPVETSVWDLARKINPQRGPGFVVDDIMNTSGNQEIDLGAIRAGDRINLSEELCEDAADNGVRTVKATPPPLDNEY